MIIDIQLYVDQLKNQLDLLVQNTVEQNENDPDYPREYDLDDLQDLIIDLVDNFGPTNKGN